MMGIIPMLLPQIPVEMFRQTENLRTVLHQAGIGTPVNCSVLPHHFNKVEYLPTLQAGPICYWRNWLMLGLQVFHQHLFCVVALATGQAVVGILCAATRLHVHIIGMAGGQVFATLFTNIVSFTLVHTQMSPESLGSRQIFPAEITMDLVLGRLGYFKGFVSSCCNPYHERHRCLALQC